MSITCTGEHTIPVGLGLNPAFENTPGARLAADVSTDWLSDDLMIPADRVSVPPEWNFTEGQKMSDVVTDSNFPNWDRNARIDCLDFGAKFEIEASPELRQLVVYSAKGGDFFCVGPVSNVADAFNLAARSVGETRLHVLAPGQIFTT